MVRKKTTFTIPEAAKLCAVDRVTMWRWVKTGIIHAWVTPGGHHRISRDDLETFLQQKGLRLISERDNALPRILVVDDDITVRNALSRALESEKFLVDSASDGFDAGLKVMRFKPDLIILDLIMPGMDGFEVCRLIKSTPETSHIRILILTGYDTEENRTMILDAGADTYLVKPIQEHILLERIHNLLSGPAPLTTTRLPT